VTRLFVGNLHYDATEKDLQEYFESLTCTVASVKIIIDKETTRSKGYGFVEVKETLEEALRLTENTVFFNRPLRVEAGNRK